MLELNNSDALLAHNKLLTSQRDHNEQQPRTKAESISNHPSYQQGYPPRNNNQGYQQRPNNQGYQQQAFQPYAQPSSQHQGGPSKLEETMTQFMQMSVTNQKNQDAAIKNLGTQVGQLAKQIVANQSNATFFANTQENPKEHCKAVVTRTGQKRSTDEVENNDAEKEDDNHAVEDEENEIIIGETDHRKMNKEVERRDKSKRKNASEKMANNMIPSQHLPYPHAPSKKDNAGQYARFMEIFKQLQINIPFSKAIAQMPKYAKFMKDILTKKKRPEEKEVVVLDAQCSAIVSRLPQKARDPERVTLPVTIGSQNIGNGLIDLGSSINLIPLSIVMRLGNIEMKLTRTTLPLADKSTTLPYGVAQDIVQDEEVCFNLFDAMKQPKDKNDCFRINFTEEVAIEVANQIHLSSPLERSLVDSFNVLTQEEEK
ncbi:uncharacterized protein LOC131651181 [Vicia villosa]|uniref:uncharacterized protein LOC131651181 n=1 Tax=Vicia villosa TaxID=3911 RepID=UPI00273BE4D8|nr:uncharacterized protein LOC131651181 [Vicia villosa]